MLVTFDVDYLPGTFGIICYCGCKYYQQFMVCVQIMEARAMLTQALDKRSKEKKESDLSAGGNIPSKEEEQHLFVPSNAQLEPVPLQTSAAEAAPSVVVSDVEMEKHVVPEIIDKSVVKEAPVISSAEQSSSGSTNRFLDETYDDDADDWLKEEDARFNP